MTAVAPPLPPDLEAGLRRLKLPRIRRLAPEACQAAKTQRWVPEELLRTLVEAEIAARDESNLRARLKQAGFPVAKNWPSSTSDSPRRPSGLSTTWPRWSGWPDMRTPACLALGAQGTLARKLREAILVMQVSRSYSKSEILQMYLSWTARALR